MGFWKSESAVESIRQRDEHLPHPSEFVDEQWAGKEREAVLDALADLDFPDLEVRQFRGFSPCRLCGEKNGSKDIATTKFVGRRATGTTSRSTT